MTVAVQGALHLSQVTRDAHFVMQGSLKPRATLTWEVPLNVETFERGTATPLVTFKKGEEDIINGSEVIEGLGMCSCAPPESRRRFDSSLHSN